MDEQELKRSMRRDIDRMIMGIVLLSIIAIVWFLVLTGLSSIEDSSRDAVMLILGATVPIITLIAQFFFRTSGDKK